MSIENQPLKDINDNPSISDNILINFDCPDSNGCNLSDPYKFNNFTIYYVNRNYSSGNNSKYEKQTYDLGLKNELDKAIKTACSNPTQENLDEVEKIRLDFENSINSNTFYYSEAVPVLSIGNEEYPAWFTSDVDNAQVVHITTDDEENDIYGKFQYIWTPLGMREGDYFLCWTWTPTVDGQTLSNHIHFNLNGDTVLTTSIPTHNTQKNKYETLLDRYTPEMFKTRYTGDKDLTPEVISEFNNSVAKGFTYLEDMANHILDLIDANSTHESFLQHLANLFSLKLRTSDPTLWRRQIKQAVSLFKKKGTLNGLKEALLQAGITLNKLTRLWQVMSTYTWQEVFDYNDTNTYNLYKTSLEINSDNFELYIRKHDEDTWTEYNISNISIVEDENSNLKIMIWNGEQLEDGDSIRLIYQIKEVPNLDEQTIENYIRLLPLADSRDERDQEFPPKNWNVRLIEEDDSLFDSIIARRNPDFEKLIFGQIRTEFPYSEKIYNMETYNGSTIDSLNPCDIDKNFVDPCHSCISSKYTLDLEIQNLSTDRLLEAQEIIKEFTPFHSILHSITISGGVDEFVKPPEEKIEILMTYKGSEFTVAGAAQTVFNRTMNSSSLLTREDLSSYGTDVLGTLSVTGKNDAIILYSPLVDFKDLPLNSNKDWTQLEIDGPSLNQGTYNVLNPSKNFIELDSTNTFSLPLNKTVFNYNLYNIRATKSSVTVYKDNYITFTDDDKDFSLIKTQWDVENSVDYFGGSWQINLGAYGIHQIKNVLPNNIIVLNYNASLPSSNTSSISYSILNDTSEVILTGTTGKIKVTNRGRVDFSGTFLSSSGSNTLESIQSLMDSYHNNGKNHYFSFNGTKYEFDNFVENSNDEFYIKNWTSADFSGSATVKLLQKIVTNDKGYLQYKGITIVSGTNLETSLDIQNGSNPVSPMLDIDDSFKENYLVKINSNYYIINEINGTTLKLIGPDLDLTLSGILLNVNIFRYSKSSVTIDERDYPPMHGAEFETIDRNGQEIITGAMPEVFSLALNTNNDQIIENVNQNQSISFLITDSNGNTTEGSL